LIKKDRNKHTICYKESNNKILFNKNFKMTKESIPRNLAFHAKAKWKNYKEDNREN